ncbi:hypothetical protein AVEN_246643-1 [Araneus ventricosus]|uniref:Uncharacterized protein n=1 Tax=Araneus ventricosus TaxID=182803 RepID=A0A4Y2KIT3_ARAVE|nr:hypothetical protein AVEN_246643-1 [Araneus ventricosus]
MRKPAPNFEQEWLKRVANNLVSSWIKGNSSKKSPEKTQSSKVNSPDDEEVSKSPIKYEEVSLDNPCYPPSVRTPPSLPSSPNMFEDMHKRAVAFFALPPLPEGYDDVFDNVVRSAAVCKRMAEDEDDSEEDSESVPLPRSRPPKFEKWVPAKLRMANESFPEGSAHATSKPIPIAHPTRKLPLY